MRWLVNARSTCQIPSVTFPPRWCAWFSTTCIAAASAVYPPPEKLWLYISNGERQEILVEGCIAIPAITTEEETRGSPSGQGIRPKIIKAWPSEQRQRQGDTSTHNSFQYNGQDPPSWGREFLLYTRIGCGPSVLPRVPSFREHYSNSL